LEEGVQPSTVSKEEKIYIGGKTRRERARRRLRNRVNVVGDLTVQTEISPMRKVKSSEGGTE